MRHLYQQGDIVAIDGGFIGNLCWNLFEPQTYDWQFLLIGGYLFPHDDYVVYSMNKGTIEEGLLSAYRDVAYKVFRVNAGNSQILGKNAVSVVDVIAMDIMRDNYVTLWTRMARAMIVCWCKQLFYEHRLRRIKPGELPDIILKCTRVINEAWRIVGFPIIPHGVCPLPAAIQQAYEQGKLSLIAVNMNKKRVVNILHTLSQEVTNA